MYMTLSRSGGGESPPERDPSGNVHEKPEHCQGALEGGEACVSKNLMRFWPIAGEWLCAKCAQRMGFIGDILN